MNTLRKNLIDTILASIYRSGYTTALVLEIV